jgi:hypothetical protein
VRSVRSTRSRLPSRPQAFLSISHS